MNNSEESLIFHLKELRKTLLKCIYAMIFVLLPIFIFVPKILDYLISFILDDTNLALNYFSPIEVFIIQIKVALVIDLIICFPYIVKQLWEFILPALYENEKKIIKSAIFTSSVLFLFGILFCSFFVLPFVIKFGMSFATENINAVLGITNVLNLSLWLILAFGFMFQFPLVVYYLIKSGIVSIEDISDKRPYVIVGLLILAAILTPPDVVSQILLFIPTYSMFELGLLYSRYKLGINTKKKLL